MGAFQIVMCCVAFIVYLLVGYVSGNVCVDIVKIKNTKVRAEYWFWLGFFLNWIAIVLTLIIKPNDKNN